MRWQRGRMSENVEDRRSMRGVGGAGMMGMGGLGLIVVLIGALLGWDLRPLASVITSSGVDPAAQQGEVGAQPTDEAGEFVTRVLGDTEDTWNAIFQAEGEDYSEPRLVLYSDIVQSACGVKQSATGPFYCPGDQQVYIDLAFMNDLQRMGAEGDFAMAYVISHEVGHHVQHLMGLDAQVRDMQSRSSQAEANQLSVLLELQADCFAGVWANHAGTERAMIDQSDVQEGLDAAAAVGDDRLMSQAGRVVQREAFTHGSSAERTQWFQTGLDSGDYNACDTFAAAGLR